LSNSLDRRQRPSKRSRTRDPAPGTVRTIKRNDYGRLEDPETGFVFGKMEDDNEYVVLGTDARNRGVKALTPSEKKYCIERGWNYIDNPSLKSLKKNTSSSLRSGTRRGRRDVSSSSDEDDDSDEYDDEDSDEYDEGSDGYVSIYVTDDDDDY